MYLPRMRVAVLGVIVAAEPHSGRSFRDGSNMLKHKKHGTQGHTMRMQLQCGWGATGMGWVLQMRVFLYPYSASLNLLPRKRRKIRGAF